MGERDSLLNTAACHCGAVVLRLARKPSEVFECNCSICRKLGVLWAYFHCDEVTIENGADTTNVYVWNRKMLGFHSCARCGCTTHWAATDSSFREKMGVNARLIEGLSPANTAVRHVDYGEPDRFWTQESSSPATGD